jgi:hypothetical protein
MIQKDWVVAANRSSKMRHYHGSRADELRSTMCRKSNGMHGAGCINFEGSYKFYSVPEIDHKKGTKPLSYIVGPMKGELTTLPGERRQGKFKETEASEDQSRISIRKLKAFDGDVNAESFSKSSR